MFRLVLFVSVMAVVQALFFAALAPLLPSFTHDLGLSKAQAGLLVGMFPVGQGIVALPVGLLASRVGVKRFALAGLVLLAATSLSFGLADSFDALLVTRLVQGIGAALCWSSGLAWLVDVAPRDRRGELIGIFSGAGAAGQVLGPAVGGLAVLVGRSGVFAGMTVAAAVLAVIGSGFPGPTRGERQSLALLMAAHRNRTVLGGLCLLAVPGMLVGTIFVLGPLQLSGLGSGAIGIAGAFLGAAALGVLGRPLAGRWADRNGQLRAIRLLLLASIPLTLVVPWVENRWLLSVCVALAVSTYGYLWGPTMTVLSHAYDEAGVAHVLGFALIGLTIGAGFFVGSTTGGVIARMAGDAAAYGVPVGACVATLGALTFRHRRQLAAGAERPAMASVDIQQPPG